MRSWLVLIDQHIDEDAGSVPPSARRPALTWRSYVAAASLCRAGSHMVGCPPARQLITFLIMSLHTFAGCSAPVEV